jgi:drug/metabolite transporter (DMT)-like permease
MQMNEALVEMAAEFGSTAIRAVGALCATVAGVFVEMNGIQTLGTGEQVIGLWMALLGCLLLVVGYVLANETLQLLRQPAN